MADAFEHLLVATYLFRQEGETFVLVSANARARTQNPLIESLIGRSLEHLYADQPQNAEDARYCVAHRTTVTRETVLRRHDKMEANERIRIVFSYVEPDHLLICVEPVAAPDLVAAALRESEERYRSLVTSIPDAMVLRDVEGRVLACNHAAAEMCGRRDIADLLGRIDILADGYVVVAESGEPVDPSQYPGRRVVATGQPMLVHSVALRSPNGSMRWYRVSAQAVLGPQGEVAGSVTIYADDTDRVVAERAAKEASDRLAMALDAARMGTWAWDQTDDVGSWSVGTNKQFGLSELQQGIGPFLAHVHPEDLEDIQSLVGSITSGTDGDAFEHEYRIVGEDGVVRWARVRGRLEKRDSAVRMAGTILDVTERRALEEELRRAHRLESIGRLAGGLAHDFNNLLAAILGSVDLLGDAVPSQAKPDLETVRHAASRARDLTAQLLAFARKQPVVLTALDLSQLVTTVERMLRRLVGPPVVLTIETTPNAWVRADPAQMEQVLINLVVNARDAMPTGGALTVRVLRETSADAAASKAVLEVQDQGRGMDEATRAHAFDPFFTTKSSGTGLGLASSYGIVSQHGGDIEVDSAPGRGTRFRVLLPGVDAPARELKVATPVSEISAGTILVVDDDASVRRTAERLLRTLGFQVVAAADGDEALARASENPQIDAVLCDLSMPVRNGLEVAADLRRSRPGLRFLFVSGYSEQAAGTSGPNSAFLAKPYTRVDLRNALLELLARE